MTDRSDKTKEAIKHALIVLMGREPFEMVAVKQIVAESGVGRSTFYAYFEDKQDVLETIERELLEELSLYRGRKSFAPTENPFNGMRSWFETCFQWDCALRALVGPNGDPRFEARLTRKVMGELHDMMDDEGIPRDVLRPYFEEMLSHAYVGLALYAVRQDPAERLGAMRLAQIANHTRAAFFREGRMAPSLSDERLFGDAGELL